MQPLCPHFHPVADPRPAGVSSILPARFPARAALLAVCLPILAGILPIPAGAQEFRPLFDGKTLSGWHLQGGGAWTVRDGQLVGTHAASDKAFGHLVSDTSFGDFTLRYHWKLVKGNSGLYYRSAEGGAAGMIGPQVEMDEAFPGGIYTTHAEPWGWVSQPKASDVPTWYRPGDWNQVTVTAKGPRVTVDYNGKRTADVSDARLPARGRFGFQVHADLDCEILVDDVEVSVPAPVALVLAPQADRARRMAPLENPFSLPWAGWEGGFRADGRRAVKRGTGNRPAR